MATTPAEWLLLYGKTLAPKRQARVARRQPGRREVAEARFDEPGYIATPPCLWGSPEHGLETPPLMNGVTIRVVAVTNTSEMALPEVTLGPA